MTDQTNDDQTHTDSDDTGIGVDEKRINTEVASPDASHAAEAELQKTDAPDGRK